MRYSLSALLLGLTLIWPATSFCAPLTEAHVTKIVNAVKLIDPGSGERAAKLNDSVHDDIAVMTGIKSRSELLFQDNTLSRLGPETYFSFKTGTRDMTLQKGTILLQVPKGIGGAKIHTATITATLTGTTIMMEYVPGRDIKVLVLEGSLRLSVNGRFGDPLLLTPGKMVIMSPGAKRIPDPVTIDLKKVVQTSKLVNMESGKHRKNASSDAPPLPSMPLIEKQVELQQLGKDAQHLVDTNLVILGKGTNVLLGSDDLMSQLALRTDVSKVASGTPAVPAPTPVATPFPTPNPAPTPNPNPPPSGTPPPPPPGIYVTDNTTVINTNSTAPTIVTQGISRSGVIYQNLQTNGSPSGFLFGSTSAFDNQFGFDNFYGQQFAASAVFTFDTLQLGSGINFNLSNGPNNVTLAGLNGITNTAASVLNLGGIDNILFATQAGSIVLDSAISFTTSADSEKPGFVGFYARGGDVNIGSTFALDHSTLNFAAENNAIFSLVAAITAKNLSITGLQTVQFDGHADVSSLFQLNGGDIEMGGTVTSQTGFFYGTSATINGSFTAQNLTADVTGDFVLNSSGSLSATGEQNMSITAGGNLTLDGTVTGKKIQLASNAVVISGTVTTNQLDTTSATTTVDGTLNARQADFETTGGFTLGSAGSLTSSNDLKINAGAAGITLDGTFNGHNVELNSTGNIAINGVLTSNQLTISGSSVFFGADLTVVTSENDLTATNGNIDATGHQIIGFNQVSLTNGSLFAGGLSASTLTFSGSGNIDIANDLTLAHSLTCPGSVNVGGVLTMPAITAGDITANAVHADTVNSSGTFTLGSTDLAPLASNTVSINAPVVSLVAGATLDGQSGTPSTGPKNAWNLSINTGTYTLSAPLSLNGGDGNSARHDAGGNGGTLNITGSDSITVNAPISTTTGQNSQNGTNGGNGGTVNLTAANTVTLNDKIEVSSNSGKRRSSKGGNINVTSNKTSGTAIAVSSSAQLLALINASVSGGGGSIKFVSAGGDINVNGATMEADHGTIDVRNNGATGVIAINNATLNASTIKIGALGNNGTLNIGNSTISADSIIRLYAGGSNGNVNFTESVTLNGNSVKTIAGDSVTIFNGKIVTVNGPAPANVFTNHPNYMNFGGNGSTTGTFAGQGATTSPLAGAPGF